jgi:hypothetical protein
LGSLAIESPVVSARSAAWIFRNSGDGQPRSRRFVLEQLRVRSEVDLPYPAAGLYAGEGLDIAFEGASISVDVLELAAVVYSDIARKDSSWIGAHGLFTDRNARVRPFLEQSIPLRTNGRRRTELYSIPDAMDIGLYHC